MESLAKNRLRWWKKLRRAVSRSSHPRSSVRKRVVKNFAKFTGKHLYQSIFLMNFAKFLRISFHRTPLDDCFSVSQCWKFTMLVVESSNYDNLYLDIRSGLKALYLWQEFSWTIKYVFLRSNINLINVVLTNLTGINVNKLIYQ